MADHAELEWSYTPADFFEVPYAHDFSECSVRVGDGIALVSIPGGKPSIVLEAEIAQRVRILFYARQVLNRKPFELNVEPRLALVKDGKRNEVLRPGTGRIRVEGNDVGLRYADAAGNVVRDAKTERLAREMREVIAWSAKAEQSALLRRMIDSYAESITDPSNEFVHLYEIRDALSKQYGSEQKASKALGITSREWSDFGKLANAEPIAEGRHRGKHDALRPATAEELEMMRRLGLAWIRALVATLS